MQEVTKQLAYQSVLNIEKYLFGLFLLVTLLFSATLEHSVTLYISKDCISWPNIILLKEKKTAMQIFTQVMKQQMTKTGC